ncbi:hypothetical protein D3C72_1910500 [compost metagenome]
MAEHEAQFALAEYRHQRVEHGADTHAGQVQGAHLPPVGQLAGHHIAFLHSQGGQPGGHPGHYPVQLAIAQRMALAIADAVGDQGRPVGGPGDGLVQIICNDHVIPGAGLQH